MIWAAIWYWLFVVFTTADVVTTKVAIASGRFHEGNPIIAGLLNHLVEVKLFALLVIAILVIVVERKHEGHGWVVAAESACLTFIVVLSNLIQIASAI